MNKISGVERLEFSKISLANAAVDFDVQSLNDTILLKYFNFANELGLKGKKIKEIVRIDDITREKIYLDFVCELEESK